MIDKTSLKMNNHLNIVSVWKRGENVDFKLKFQIEIFI